MASGSSKAFDFASDDILCSYEDYANQDNSNGSHSDSASGTNSTKEFHKGRMARTSVFPTYGAPDDSGNHEVIVLAVERSMKQHTDNLMRFLEGLSSRLSQLELYCYNLDKSIGEMRSDLTRDHGESDAKLKFLEKHLQEVHRSVQILRDKRELTDTQKELAKLQFAQKESSSSHNSHRTEEGSSTLDTKKNGGSPDSHGQQLAIVPASQPQRPPEPFSQPQAYYLPPAPLSGIPGSTQLNQAQYPQSQVPPPQLPQSQPQIHSLPQYQPQLAQQLNQAQYPQHQLPPPQLQQSQSQIHSLPQYQQQLAQQVQPQPPMQSGSRPSSPQVYPQYLPTQLPVNLSPIEPLPNSMPMQMPYSAIPPPGSGQPGTYSYGGPVRSAQPQPPPPQHLEAGFAGQRGDVYAASGQPNVYMMHDNESGRGQHPSQAGHFYPPNQQQSSGGMMPRPTQKQQFMRNHPYTELIDKLVSMGYRSDHVMSVIQRLDEAGQTVDFNAVLDRLNAHSSVPGGSQRGWSG